MSNPVKTFAPSFRGVPFTVDSVELEGGRHLVRKVFANSDVQAQEDMGLRQPSFILDGVISAQATQSSGEILSYETRRDNLLAALNSDEGPGILIHPTLGRIDNIVCHTFNLHEAFNRLGDARITMHFEVDNTAGAPVLTDEPGLGGLIAADDVVQAQTITEMVNDWFVNTSFAGNWSDAVEKATEVSTAINEASELVAASTDKINAFSQQISDYVADIPNLITVPQEFAESITGLTSTLRTIYPTAEATFVVLQGLFGFGSTDTTLGIETAAQIERKKNRDIVNSTVVGTITSHAYLSAAEIDFLTVDEIEAASDVLEAQYQVVAADPDTPEEILDALTDMRTTTMNFFEIQKLNAKRVLEIQTQPSSARLIAYRYYGSSDLGETLADLNFLQDMSYVTGSFKVLSA